jgi:hypothetical protein
VRILVNIFVTALIAAGRAYTTAALDPATLRAYVADQRRFCAWCEHADYACCRR